MALLEQYPEWAMRANAQNEREKRPWVSGISPLASGLMAAGFGMMGDGASEWVGGGGFNWDAMGRGGLLGLQAYQNANKNLQDQRSTFFDQRRLEEDQKITNIKARQEFEDRKEKEAQFPILIEKLRKLNNPAITARLPALMTLGQGNINSGYNSAANLLSTATKAKSGNIRITEDGLIVSNKLASDGTKIGEAFHGQLTTPTKTKSSSFEKLTSALSKDGTKLNPNLYQLHRQNYLAGKTKYPKKYTGENVEQLLRVVDPGAHQIPNVFEYIKQYRPDLMTKPDGSEMTRAELKEKYKLSDPEKQITEVTAGVKKPSSDSIRDLLKISGIKFTDKFLKQQLEKGKYDPTKIKFETWLAYVTQSGLKMPGPAKSYEDTAQVGARLFGYLMSGATVKEEEMTAMRTAFYPVPGDSQADVQRKRKYRRAMVNIFISQLSPQMKKIMENEIEKIEKIASNPALVTKEITSPKKKNTKNVPIIKLNPSESKITLDKIWKEK